MNTTRGAGSHQTCTSKTKSQETESPWNLKTIVWAHGPRRSLPEREATPRNLPSSTLAPGYHAELHPQKPEGQLVDILQQATVELHLEFYRQETATSRDEVQPCRHSRTSSALAPHRWPCILGSRTSWGFTKDKGEPPRRCPGEQPAAPLAARPPGPVARETGREARKVKAKAYRGGGGHSSYARKLPRTSSCFSSHL